MKTLRFLPVMLLFCLFVGCNTENVNENRTSPIEVKAVPNGAQKVAKVNQKISNEETETVFTTNNIVSYNGKTGEIIFKDLENNESLSEILSKFNENLDFYKDGVLLFSLKSKIVLDIDNAIYNEPILHYSSLENNNYFIKDGYPWGFPLDDTTTVRTGQSASVENVRKANVNQILEGWKIFINELKEEGKYIEN